MKKYINLIVILLIHFNIYFCFPKKINRSQEPTQNCTWTDHCLGASCITYDDCSDDLICSSNICSLINPTSIPSTSNVTEAETKKSSEQTAFITFYGFDDNDDGDPSHTNTNVIQFPGFHQHATEDLAHPEFFIPGEKVYVPRLKKYYIYEDGCVECTSDAKSKKLRIDLYMGENKSQNQPLIDCELL
ncbi:hypothetical protein HK099_000097 [Clydaea vesicula]|uniref:Uncharacterized protein n=1 Tax=Clydaea vesicula TaxID=447962 RepID=A0AAD5TVQ3_9FUNG|nr:hypothetical protein HK099_000097 [Clydaea vesicula]